MIEGSKNLKGNDKGNNKHEISQSAKDAKKLDNKGADKLAQQKGYEDAHELKKNYVGDNGGKYDIIKNAKTGQTFLIDKSGKILIPIED